MKLSVKTIVAIGIGAAIFFVLARYLAIPSPVPNTTFSIQYGVLGFMAALFGPIAGCLIGLIGHFLNDLSAGWGVWWSWVFASAIFGLIMGIICLKLNLENGEFGTGKIILFNVGQIIAHAVAWIAVAPTLDILMYSEPADKVYIQGVWAFVGNVITTLIVGTILCVVYAKSRPQKGSLSKD